MKVLVDTSAWVDFVNGFPSHEAEALSTFLAGDVEICTCGIVVTEVFQGLRQDRRTREVEAFFRDLTFLEAAGFDIHLRAAEVYRTLRRRGVTVRSTVDCVIVAIAEEHGCGVLARDRDIREIIASKVTSVEAVPRIVPGQ